MVIEKESTSGTEARVCPQCERKRMFAHTKGTFEHCFACGTHVWSVPADGMQEALQELFKRSLATLLADKDRIAVLTGKHKLHAQVLIDSMIGVLPEAGTVEELFSPAIERAKEHLSVLQDSRQRGRPSKEEQEALASAESQVRVHEQTMTELQAFSDRTVGELVFFYTNAEHRIVRVRTATGEEWGSGGVFNHQLFAPGAAKSLEVLHARPTLVASEFDLLQLQSVGARLAELEGLAPEKGYLPAAALGLGPIDANTARAFGRMPLVIRDSARKASGVRVVAELKRVLNLNVAVVPDEATLEEWLRNEVSPSAAGHGLENLVAGATLVTRPFSEVRGNIDHWRAMESKEARKFESDRWAARELLTDLRERGQFFYDGRQAYLFEKQTKQLYPVEPDHVETRLFLHRYGIAPQDSFFKAALNEMTLEAQKRGQKTTVHSLAHYDKSTNRLYLFDHDCTVYRISESAIERVSNGTDGVLFVRNPKATPFVIGTPTGEGQRVVDALIGSVRLNEGFLTRENQELLFRSWLHAMLLPELFPTRPILAMIGEKGSGKTSVLRRVGQLLVGPSFQVMGMSHEPRDFDAAVTADAFVALDNADADIKWLDDKLAVVATGGTMKRRRYYTTNEQVEFPITAFLGITSRTPHFRREDVADRLLIFNVERLESFGAESALLEELASERDALMTELVGDLQRVLGALKKTKSKPYPTTFRLADFASFVLRVADAEGRLEEGQEVFARLAAEQLAFTVQDDPVMELLERWVSQPGKAGRELSTAALFSELKVLSVTSSTPIPFDFKSAQAFGKYLHDHRSTLRAVFGATDRTVGGRKRLWTFNVPKEGIEGETVSASEIETEGYDSLLEELKKFDEYSIS